MSRYLTDRSREALEVSQDIGRIGSLALAANLISSGSSLPPDDPRQGTILVDLVDVIEILANRAGLTLSELTV